MRLSLPRASSHPTEMAFGRIARARLASPRASRRSPPDDVQEFRVRWVMADSADSRPSSPVYRSAKFGHIADATASPQLHALPRSCQIAISEGIRDSREHGLSAWLRYDRVFYVAVVLSVAVLAAVVLRRVSRVSNPHRWPPAYPAPALPSAPPPMMADLVPPVPPSLPRIPPGWGLVPLR